MSKEKIIIRLLEIWKKRKIESLKECVKIDDNRIIDDVIIQTSCKEYKYIFDDDFKEVSDIYKNIHIIMNKDDIFLKKMSFLKPHISNYMDNLYLFFNQWNG